MEDFHNNKHFEFGTSNPTLMDKPFWKYMVCNPSLSAHCVTPPREYYDKAVWTFDRFGRSETRLPDGRIIFIGGEHEDYYDVNFQIYNDVIVIQKRKEEPSFLVSNRNEDSSMNFNDVTIYGYPEDIFPPTDFHTATYIKTKDNDEFIYIVGGLGYLHSQYRIETLVHRLRLSDFSMEKLETSGKKPAGCTQRHSAKLVERDGRQIIEISSQVNSLKWDASKKEIKGRYELDVETAEWSHISH